jgi:hypothetical protein
MMAESDEEKLRKLEKREQKIRAQKNQIRARMAKRERTRRTHGLVELGAGIDAEVTALSFEAFTGDKTEVQANRDRLHRTLTQTLRLSDGQTLTIAQIIDQAWQISSRPARQVQNVPPQPAERATEEAHGSPEPVSYAPTVHRERGYDDGKAF